MRDPAIAGVFRGIDSVQLDMWSDTPVVTPGGKRTTAREWAKELELFYAPSLLFFDGQGRQIIKVDSVVGFFRLSNVLNYIASGDYLREPNFQHWRVEHYKGMF